ncbi:MAG: hypothetical protein IT345_15170 [Trueperaceae bacterium]|nr:hypothetical protein [Trueperaceae bacterium]
MTIPDDDLRELEARTLLAAARMEQRTRQVTLDALRPFLRHVNCDETSCTCGLTAIVTILETDAWAVPS